MKIKNVLRFLPFDHSARLRRVSSVEHSWLRVTIVTFFILLIVNCSENPSKPPPPTAGESRETITVSIEQITHRSISVGVNHRVTLKGSSYVLNRISGLDTFAFMPFALSQSDTLIIDDNDGEGLTIDSEYSYFAYRLDSTGIPKDTSNIVTAKTLAATSHDFTWTEYPIGDGGELFDVWGTDGSNLYAVGGVRFGDSTFGVIKWDGSQWKPEVFIGGKKTIYGFSEDDIWVGGNGSVIHFNGNLWEDISSTWINGNFVVLDEVLASNGPYRAIWGTSSDNLYFGGDKGKIVHWNGQKGSVENIQAGQFIRDIWGFSKNDIYACAATLDGNHESELFHWDGKNWTVLVEGGLDGELIGAFWSVWGFEPNLLYMSGDRIYSKTGDIWESLRPGFFTRKIRGSQSNNIFTVGEFGGVAHFNGIDWQILNHPQLNNSNNTHFSIFTTGNTAFIVGDNFNGATIYIGKQ